MRKVEHNGRTWEIDDNFYYEDEKPPVFESERVKRDRAGFVKEGHHIIVQDGKQYWRKDRKLVKLVRRQFHPNFPPGMAPGSYGCCEICTGEYCGSPDIEIVKTLWPAFFQWAFGLPMPAAPFYAVGARPPTPIDVLKTLDYELTK